MVGSLIDYSKRRADSSSTDDHDPTNAVGINLRRHRNSPRRNQQAVEKRIQAGQMLGAKADCDKTALDDAMPMSMTMTRQRPAINRGKLEMNEPLPTTTTNLLSTTSPKIHRRIIKRCGTSELVKEHRNRRPTTLREMSHGGGLGVSTRSSLCSSMSSDEFTEEEKTAMTAKQNKFPRPSQIDWSQPSIRTTTTTTTNPDNDDDADADASSVGTEKSGMEKLLDFRKLTQGGNNTTGLNSSSNHSQRSLQITGTQEKPKGFLCNSSSMSDLKKQNKRDGGCCSFTLRKRRAPRADDHMRNSDSSVTRLEQSLSCIQLVLPNLPVSPLTNQRRRCHSSTAAAAAHHRRSTSLGNMLDLMALQSCQTSEDNIQQPQTMRRRKTRCLSPGMSTSRQRARSLSPFQRGEHYQKAPALDVPLKIVIIKKVLYNLHYLDSSRTRGLVLDSM